MCRGRNPSQCVVNRCQCLSENLRLVDDVSCGGWSTCRVMVVPHVMAFGAFERRVHDMV
jgi:hypothetical protein